MSAGLLGVACSSVRSCIAVGSAVTYAYCDGCGVTNLLAERWDGRSWSVRSVPEGNSFAALDNTALTSVSCPSTSCVAVGRYRSAAGVPVSLAERWDGTRWALQLPINGLGWFGWFSAQLSAVSCRPSGCAAVGGFRSGPAGGTFPLAGSTGGDHWATSTVIDPFVMRYEASLSGVACAPVGPCIVVGNLDPGDGPGSTGLVAATLDGGGATLARLPEPTGGHDATLDGVACRSDTDCLAVGSFTDRIGATAPLAEHWDGRLWTVEPGAVPNLFVNAGLHGVSCVPGSFCLAIGEKSTGTGRGTAWTAIWNGSTWTSRPLPHTAGPTDTTLNGVSCTSATDCTAVGWSTNARNEDAPVIEHWDGAAWSEQASAPLTLTAPARLYGVACASPGQCTAVGFHQAGTYDHTPLIETSDGGLWTAKPAPDPSGPQENVTQLTGVSCTAATTCTAVGVLETSSGVDEPLVESIADPAAAPAG